MKKVFTVGVFDYFHYGHYKLFEMQKNWEIILLLLCKMKIIF